MGRDETVPNRGYASVNNRRAFDRSHKAKRLCAIPPMSAIELVTKHQLARLGLDWARIIELCVLALIVLIVVPPAPPVSIVVTFGSDCSFNHIVLCRLSDLEPIPPH